MKLQLCALAVTTSSLVQGKGNGSCVYTELWVETGPTATSSSLHEYGQEEIMAQAAGRSWVALAPWMLRATAPADGVNRKAACCSSGS